MKILFFQLKKNDQRLVLDPIGSYFNYKIRLPILIDRLESSQKYARAIYIYIYMCVYIHAYTQHDRLLVNALFFFFYLIIDGFEFIIGTIRLITHFCIYFFN